MKNKLFVYGIVCLLACAAAVTSCAKKTVAEDTLSIGMEIGYPPFEYFDDAGNVVGFDAQMAKAIAEKLGKKPEFINTDWTGIFAGIDSRRYDVVISAATFTEERKNAFSVSKPYIGNAQALILRKDSKATAANPQELTGLKVGYQADTTTDIYMTDLAAKGLRFEPFEYDKIINCFDELKIGRIDAIVCDSTVAFFYGTGDDSVYKIVWQGETEETFAIYAHKENGELMQKIDAALDELFADGTMQRISQEIFNEDLVSAVR
ncbi:MAG: cystine ABC transporter substrate-binding protein [Treponemataceae bacterium]|nr:MAG: cystine ABC transporter substrate-binding protein [Treponemataceae bacterium]